MESFVKTLKDLSLRDKVLVLIVVLFLLLLAIMVVRNFRGNTNSPISSDQIQIEKGEEIITINKNGLVEYRSNDRVFYETWDSGQITFFFNSLAEKAKKYLSANKAGSDCGDNFKVTLYVDGKLVSVCIDETDSDIAEIYANFDEGNIDITLDDYFGDITDNDGTSGSGSSATPTLPAAQPTPISTPVYNPGSGGSSTNYPPVEAGCDAWSQYLQKKAIISNTYCDITPTPAL